MKSFTWVTVFIIMLSGTFDAIAQNALPPQPSPNAISTLKYEGTYIKITYCRPHQRGRTVFGGMIPYGKVWRTGANEATELTITREILIGGKKLAAGTYSIFTIPYPDEWIIIINSEVGQWGAYEYNKERDVLRFTVPVAASNIHHEPFTIEFEQKEKITNLLMQWDRTKVIIPIRFL